MQPETTRKRPRDVQTLTIWVRTDPRKRKHKRLKILRENVADSKVNSSKRVIAKFMSAMDSVFKSVKKLTLYPQKTSCQQIPRIREMRRIHIPRIRRKFKVQPMQRNAWIQTEDQHTRFTSRYKKNEEESDSFMTKMSLHHLQDSKYQELNRTPSSRG